MLKVLLPWVRQESYVNAIHWVRKNCLDNTYARVSSLRDIPEFSYSMYVDDFKFAVESTQRVNSEVHKQTLDEIARTKGWYVV